MVVIPCQILSEDRDYKNGGHGAENRSVAIAIWIVQRTVDSFSNFKCFPQQDTAKLSSKVLFMFGSYFAGQPTFVRMGGLCRQNRPILCVELLWNYETWNNVTPGSANLEKDQRRFKGHLTWLARCFCAIYYGGINGDVCPRPRCL
jgi:hypothetical protein